MPKPRLTHLIPGGYVSGRAMIRIKYFITDGSEGAAPIECGRLGINANLSRHGTAVLRAL
jgi:hypothetical protein